MDSTVLTTTLDQQIFKKVKAFIAKQRFCMVWEDQKEFEFETSGKVAHVRFLLINIGVRTELDSHEQTELIDSSVEVAILLESDNSLFDVENDNGVMTLTAEQQNELSTLINERIDV